MNCPKQSTLCCCDEVRHPLEREPGVISVHGSHGNSISGYSTASGTTAPSLPTRGTPGQRRRGLPDLIARPPLLRVRAPEQRLHFLEIHPAPIQITRPQSGSLPSPCRRDTRQPVLNLLPSRPDSKQGLRRPICRRLWAHAGMRLGYTGMSSMWTSAASASARRSPGSEVRISSPSAARHTTVASIASDWPLRASSIPARRPS
jgi:hypothetical protein